MKLTRKDRELIRKWHKEGVSPECIAVRIGMEVENVKKYLRLV